MLSAFDGVRREIARLTLESLIADGRIHPVAHRGDVLPVQGRDRAADRPRPASRRASRPTCTALHPELVKVLGRLQLPHELRPERAQALGRVRAPGLDHGRRARRQRQKTARRPALLHDIGKAVTTRSRARTPSSRRRWRKKYRESPSVCHAIEAHHHDVEPQTVEAVLVHRGRRDLGRRGPAAAARASSTTSSGSRRSSGSPTAKEGVERCYAMQAGREIRVMVKPEQVDDDTAALLSHQIAREIEDGARVSGPDQGDGDPGVAGHRDREVNGRAYCRVYRRLTGAGAGAADTGRMQKLAFITAPPGRAGRSPARIGRRPARQALHDELHPVPGQRHGLGERGRKRRRVGHALKSGTIWLRDRTGQQNRQDAGCTAPASSGSTSVTTAGRSPRSTR